MTRRAAAQWIAAMLAAVAAASAQAAPCEREDFERNVSGVSQCLRMQRFGPEDPRTLVVWLHGDVSSGGPADYHVAYARALAQDLAPARVLAVALVRPGYPDGSGESSGVAALHAGRNDHYTQENLAEVGGAIARLRQRFRPERLVVVGHSGGAATTAVLLGMQPGSIDAAVLVACPCDIVAWRSGRRPWTRSENPMAWTGKVDAKVRVVALTGSADDNTPPALARAWVDALRARGIDAAFVELAAESHNGAARAPQVRDAIAAFVGAR